MSSSSRRFGSWEESGVVLSSFGSFQKTMLFHNIGTLGVGPWGDAAHRRSQNDVLTPPARGRQWVEASHELSKELQWFAETPNSNKVPPKDRDELSENSKT